MIDETNQQVPVGDQQQAEVPEDLGEVEAITQEEGGAEGNLGTMNEADALRREFEQTRDQLLRMAAEFENYKKRMERERSKLLKYAGENILRELLATLDNLDRAIEQGAAATDEDGAQLQSLLKGLELTRKGLVATLERFGVEPLDSIGHPFNPDEHDAMTMEADEDIPANHVLREYAKGYRFKDRVLRHAQVVVSSGPVKAA